MPPPHTHLSPPNLKEADVLRVQHITGSSIISRGHAASHCPSPLTRLVPKQTSSDLEQTVVMPSSNPVCYQELLTHSESSKRGISLLGVIRQTQSNKNRDRSGHMQDVQNAILMLFFFIINYLEQFFWGHPIIWLFTMHEKHKQSYICDDDPWIVLVKIQKKCALKECMQNMEDKQRAYHGEHTVLQRMHGSGQRTKLPVCPARWAPSLLWHIQVGFNPDSRSDCNICPKGNSDISWCTGSGGGWMLGVSILLLNLEEETNPGSKRATVLSETSHGDREFRVNCLLSNSTIFIKTLHLDLRLIHGEPPYGHCQSGL